MNVILICFTLYKKKKLNETFIVFENHFSAGKKKGFFFHLVSRSALGTTQWYRGLFPWG